MLDIFPLSTEGFTLERTVCLRGPWLPGRRALGRARVSRVTCRHAAGLPRGRVVVLVLPRVTLLSVSHTLPHGHTVLQSCRHVLHATVVLSRVVCVSVVIPRRVAGHVHSTSICCAPRAPGPGLRAGGPALRAGGPDLPWGALACAWGALACRGGPWPAHGGPSATVGSSALAE